ncbi:molybdopterin-dependent oxidoreductase [Clostridium formicaceticum]|uniref:Nitrate reductase n=1 Tax=Clostridium formicaceticum TaxID=1497 RepID=A0AAC9WI05_9CLOT|nr:molybdopterin-dependent oxidoreductase [Clostridium formicaceticum]AOY75219.1 nitrate reductase [Clostridium formicaceticum]ARE89652.1 Assimilatory nitrate reductase catalytic subunit [Clostridium formicaceticum]
MKTFKTACPLDCFDVCSIQIDMKEDRVSCVRGDDQDPITKGFLCKKGRNLLERLSHKKRVTAPLKKVEGQWTTISWQKAIEEIGNALLAIKDHHGSNALIHYSESGHGGLLKSIDTAFFNSYGGVTTPKGSLCWGAGIEAQTLDFGDVLGHDPHDHLHAKTILIWGRNPSFTNVHLIPFLKEAQSKGTKLVVIDPVKTATASFADYYYQVKPEADGHLAMAMAKIILQQKKYDASFIKNYCKGFEDFKEFIDNLQLQQLIEATGLTKKEVYELTALYSQHKPSCIILGYGLQRYKRGGNNIRFIDALGALTGNIGLAGGGVNYANKSITKYIDWHYIKNNPLPSPTFKRPLFSKYVLEENKGKIQGIVVTKSNVVLQLPDTQKAIEAFSSIPFKVVIDHFITDTAELADYILPCTGIYEEEDFIFSSMWHSYFTYTEKIMSPPPNVKHEFEIFHLLAQHMKMKDFLRDYSHPKQYLETALAPLLKHLGCELETIKGKRIKLETQDIPWQDKQFATTSGKFEFISTQEDLLQENNIEDPRYPLQFLTLHPKASLHSQHFIDVERNRLPEAFVNENTLRKWNLEEGQEAMLVSPNGKLKIRLLLDEGIGENIVVSYEGWWLKNQGVNHLTPEGISDIGNQAIYNNCRCKIIPI